MLMNANRVECASAEYLRPLGKEEAEMTLQ